MNWYKIATNGLQIVKENLPDRIRFLLKNNDKQVGKLTIQSFSMDQEYYYLTAFWIDAEYRGQGWGKKMIEMALSDSRFDKPILVKPKPYSQDEKIETDLISMYKHFGFEDFKDGYLIYDKKLKGQK